MKKALILCLLVGACGFAQTIATFPNLSPFPNDGTTGTSLHKLAKLTVSGNAITASISDARVIGIVEQGPGTSGTAYLATQGIALCAFDNTTSPNDFAQISTTTGGDCHDAGGSIPSSGQILGVVVTASSGGTAEVLLSPTTSFAGPSGVGNATSFSGVNLSGTPTDGQAYVYNAGSSTFTAIAVPYWEKHTVSFSQLTGFNALTGTVTLQARANRQKVCGVSVYVTTGFSGGGITGMSTTVGDSNGTAALYTPQAIDVRDNGAEDFNVLGSSVGSSNITATFTATGANLNLLTAGSADVDLCLVNTP